MSDAISRRITNWLLGKPDKETDEYLQALGTFIQGFADTELALQEALWRLARLKPPIAQAVLSGVRTEAAISLINRIADAKSWSNKRKAQFKHVFDQLQAINRLRNDILHHGSHLQKDGTWLSTNQKFVHVLAKTRRVTVTKTGLEQATGDLFEIRCRLVLLLHPSKKAREVFSKVLTPAWRYKSAPQGRKARMNRTAHQKRQRQPRSSRA
jgi:hypothetical protein